jgi:pimeloyl-ACP methyl ester carboxylesterase
MSHIPVPPDLSTSLTDFPRATLETLRLGWQFRRVLKEVPKGQGQPVICVSGYGAGDLSMLPLREFLRQAGYNPLPASIGLNRETKEERIRSIDDATAFRKKMVALLAGRVEEVARQERQKVALIGWSMGGLFAFDVAQHIPDKVSMAITLGSPFGDPRGTATFHLFRWLNGSKVPLEQQDFAGWMERAEVRSHDVPVKVIYSRQDGIVAEGAALLAAHPAVEHVETKSSHVGFAVNPAVYAAIGRLLPQLRQ